MAQPEKNMKCISLREAWEELKRVRLTIEDYFASSTPDFREAATMTAIELAENVLKHGTDPGSGLVTMSMESGEVTIATQNRVGSSQKAQQVRQRIQGISQKGAREMYVARMLELMQEPDAKQTGLGLLRIAYEGAFQLSCEVFGDRLHIQAKRRMDDALPS